MSSKGGPLMQADGCRVGALTGNRDCICDCSAQFEFEPFLDCDVPRMGGWLKGQDTVVLIQ